MMRNFQWNFTKQCNLDQSDKTSSPVVLKRSNVKLIRKSQGLRGGNQKPSENQKHPF